MKAAKLGRKAIPWGISLVCFGYLGLRLDHAAARQGQEVLPYLIESFAGIRWGAWLALMIPYSLFYFMIDSLVTWRVIRWFNAPVRLRDIVPIRGSAYILSILNEQVSKGAIALYLNRRDKVPGWQVGSSMLFIMFCEFYYLLIWATLGITLHQGDFPAVFGFWIPRIAGGAGLFFVVWLLWVRGHLPFAARLRQRPLLHSFTRAGLGHYIGIIALRSPALLAAVFVYTTALGLFGVQVPLWKMLGYLPVIFFGAATPGPMRSVAIVLWVVLFPEQEARMTIFGFVQHNFFIFFNAVIGLVFLRRASRELFGDV